jgi:hypothetical protein
LVMRVVVIIAAVLSASALVLPTMSLAAPLI